jgi:alpha-1,2-mannosyltransferase
MISTGDFAILCLFIIARLVSAKYSIIPDCDEVFNYWEPLHFLTHGFGAQTWEYSPEYAIRSWAYLWAHGVAIKLSELILSATGLQPKYFIFYGLRTVFATVCVLCDFALYRSAKKNLSSSIAVGYAVISASSTGMFHASVAFLPSTFAMNCVTLAMSQFLNISPTGFVSSYCRGFVLIAVAGILGWPFALAVGAPFGLYYLLNITHPNAFAGLLKALMAIGTIAGITLAIDSVSYRSLQLGTLNIVLYNVFGGEGQGPEIFGVEDWKYYLHNLLLNFNIAYPLSILAFATPVLFYLLPASSTSLRVHPARLALTTSPLLLWSAIFYMQPHKEERFFYVVYQLIALSAAISLEWISAVVHAVGLKGLKALTIALALSGIASISVLRSVSLAQNYSAAIHVLKTPQLYEGEGTTFCLGREWYRFPSSYFLAPHQRLRFVKSGFKGLLPTSFEESDYPNMWWNLPGTSSIPLHMNNLNLEAPELYIEPSQCDFVVDIDIPANSEEGEISYFTSPEWKKINCRKFLDFESSGPGKLLWLPKSLHGLTKTSLKHHEYCLFEKVKNE